MTRFILLLITSLFCFTTAKGQSQHMTFKNIPIDGSLNSFIHKLENIGYTLNRVNDDNTAAVMKGEFVGEKCVIYIIATKKNNKVWKVAAQLPKIENWYSLKSDYFKFKKLYTEKYHKPDSSFEFFSSPYYEGDSYELQAVKLKKCNYISFFNFQEGGITVKIDSDCTITLCYEDSINSNLDDLEKSEIINNDL